jgi:hypothetical protein
MLNLSSFQLVQQDAMTEGSEHFAENDFGRVFEQRMQLIKPMMGAIRTGKDLSKYSDIDYNLREILDRSAQGRSSDKPKSPRPKPKDEDAIERLTNRGMPHAKVAMQVGRLMAENPGNELADLVERASMEPEGQSNSESDGNGVNEALEIDTAGQNIG